MDQRNIIAAIALSVAILLGWQLLIEGPRIEQERARQERQAAESAAGAPAGVAPAPPPAAAGAPVAGAPDPAPLAPPRAAVVASDPRVRIETGRLAGSIRLAGALIDDLTLTGYRQEVGEDSAEIVLLSPPDTESPYFARFGWVAAPGAGPGEVPGPETVWRADRAALAPGRPVTLSWTSPGGVEFEQEVSVDDGYMFSVVQRVRNRGGAAVTLSPFGLVSLTGTPETSGFWILHEGLIGVFDNQLTEVDYDDLQDDGRTQTASTGGWLGITAKYFATALIPDQAAANTGRFVHTAPQGVDKYQADFLAAARTVAPGAAAEFSARLFAGAKEVRLLDSYEERLGIPRFDRMVDFGWFYFLTKPIFYVIEYFYRMLGNFGLAILLLTVIIKILFFPLANKSYRSMSRLKTLQPKMVEIRERFKDDRQRQQQEMMEMYKREGANPMSGCFPILIQIPVFFALYKVLFVTIEMRHAPFFGWIRDLSAPDPLGVLTLFGLVPWDVPEALVIVNIGIWPVIMGGTMYLQQKLNPQPADPMQQKVFMLLPIVFTFLLGSFPAGLVIYWAWNNLLSIAQQWVIMRQMGVTASGQLVAQPSPPPRGRGRAGGGEDPDAPGDGSGDGPGDGPDAPGDGPDAPGGAPEGPGRPAPRAPRRKPRRRRRR